MFAPAPLPRQRANVAASISWGPLSTIWMFIQSRWNHSYWIQSFTHFNTMSKYLFTTFDCSFRNYRNCSTIDWNPVTNWCNFYSEICRFSIQTVNESFTRPWYDVKASTVGGYYGLRCVLPHANTGAVECLPDDSGGSCAQVVKTSKTLADFLNNTPTTLSDPCPMGTSLVTVQGGTDVCIVLGCAPLTAATGFMEIYR